MADFWVAGPFPTVASLIVRPAQNLSRGKTITVSASTPLTLYPAENLVDGSTDSVFRVSETAVTFKVDLGGSVTPALLGLCNTSLDEGLLIGVTGSLNADLSSPVLSVEFAARTPNCWIDLRGGAAMRYVRLTITGNSHPVTIGELVVATATVLDGAIDAGHEALMQSYHERSFTDAGVVSKVSAGVNTRALKVSVVLTETERAAVEAVFDDAGLTGERMFFIPDSRDNDLWMVDLPAVREITRLNQRESALTLELVEQSAGAL